MTAPRSKRRGFVVRLAVVGITALTALLIAGSALALNVTGFTPNSGLPNKDAGSACPGNVITISGSGFVNDGSPVTVSFNGTPVQPGGLQVGGDDKIYAIVPDGATTGPITVSDAKGSVTAPGGTFYVNPCPQVSLAAALANPSSAAGQMTPGLLGKKAVSPSSGKVGTKVTLTGYDLLGVTGVAFGGVKAKFQIVSPTQITTTVPAGAKTGKIQLSYTIAPTVSQGGVTPDPSKNGQAGNPSATQLSPHAFKVVTK